MKKALTIVTSIIAATLTAPVLSEFASEEAAVRIAARQEQRRQQIQEMMRKGITDDAALREAIRQMPYLGTYPEELTGNLRKLVETTEIPHERVIKTVESMIREMLSAVERNERDSISWSTADLIPMFKVFPDYDVLPIIQECLVSKNETVRCNAIQNYIYIEGAKSIPFVRNTIEKTNLTGTNRWGIYRQLELTAIELTSENKTNDVEKINAFLKEMKQAEQAKEKGGN